MQLKPLNEQTIVITGASSGIGLATARAASAAGANVVLAARTREALTKAVDQAKQAGIGSGGNAVFVVADVTKREDLEALALAATERFGGFDTWVNNAGVGIWGRIDEVSDEDMRQLFEINFWGTVHGSRIAAEHLRAEGGALINVGSVTSDYAIPLQGIYSASKHAVKGFTDALRTELEAVGAPVSVTLIKPASIGTPMPQHVKNYTRGEAKFPPPVYSPDEVAAAILHAAAYPARDLFVGGAAATMSGLNRRLPRLMDKVAEKFVYPIQLGRQAPTATDNLHSGQSDGEIMGDHQGSWIRPSGYTRARTNPGATLAAAGAVAAGVGLFLWSRNRAHAQVEQSAAEEVEAHPS